MKIIKNCNITIVDRDDLIIDKKDLPISKIQYFYLKESMDPVRISSIMMFIDNNGDTKILKNRWGKQGIIL